MKLVRLALVDFTLAPENLPTWNVETESVTVEARPARGSDGQELLLFIAQTELAELPMSDSHKMIHIPEADRRRAEEVIELLANLYAITTRCQRSISSPHPCVYLIAVDDDERTWLGERVAVRVNQGGSPNVVSTPDFNSELAAALSDRNDGVALLAEALSHSHPTGKFHEFMRVFERAFALGPYRLIDPLAAFLEPGPFGYTHQEVLQWIELRQPATHADRRAEFVLEADVRPVIDRLEQAAYDVLLNKRDWRNPGVDRRRFWKPTGGTRGAGQMFIVQGTTPSIRFQILDSFGTYPLNLNASGVPNLPAEWWWRGENERSSDDDAGATAPTAHS